MRTQLKMTVAIGTSLFCGALWGCAPVHVNARPGALAGTALEGTTAAWLAGHHFAMHELIGDELGPTGGFLIAAAPEKFDQHKTEEAVEVSRNAEKSPTTTADARSSTSADLNQDGYVTLDEVVALKRAGLTDAEMADRLRATQQVFSLTPEQERYLTDRGVSHDVAQVIVDLAKENDDANANAKAQVASASVPTTQPSHW